MSARRARRPLAARGMAAGGAVALAAAAWCGAAQAVPGGDAGAPLLRVALRPQVQVQRPDVRLGDVALLSSPDLETLRRAMAVPLGQAPRLGEPVALDGGRLRIWLRSRTGLRDEQIEWEGAEATSVRMAVREVAGDAVAAQARTALAAHLEGIARQRGLVQPRVELQPVSLPAALEVPAADAVLRVRPLAQVPLAARMMVWVDVFSGERHVRAIPVRFEVALFAMAPVARQALAAGSDIPADGVVVREVDMARLPSSAAPAAWPVQGGGQGAVQARRRLSGGDVVTEDRIGPAPAVARGQWVRLTARAGDLALESRAESLQDGQVGQVVKVRPPHAGEALLARVVGPGQLELQP